MIEIRPYREGDAAACGALFHRAVHEGAAGHYSAEQRAAWAPYPVLPPDVEARFDQRLSQQITWVAEENGAIEGFMSLRQDGYVDYTYVAPERMGTGLAGELYKKIKASARKLAPEATHYRGKPSRPAVLRPTRLGTHGRAAGRTAGGADPQFPDEEEPVTSLLREVVGSGGRKPLPGG